MKIKGELLVVFLAVMFIALTCGGGSAEMNVGPYELGGYISLGGGWLSDQPRGMNRGYLKQYVPFPQGFLAETDISLKSKEGLDYYRFRMSHPGLRDQDYLLQVGKLGVYHVEIEYDQMQHLYCTVNPYDPNIGIMLQRLRFSGYYTPTLDITLFAEDTFLRRNGLQAGSVNAGGGSPYSFTTNLRPIDYKQNDMKVGAEYDQSKANGEPSVFQTRVTYHLSTFENGTADFVGRTPPVGATVFQSMPPSNMANYINAEGALNLKSYMTRITGSLSYGWLFQNDYVFDAVNAGPAQAPTKVAGRFDGLAGLGATTLAADIAGITRPIDPLAFRYSYHAYNYANNDSNNQILSQAFNNPSGASFLRPLMQYSYLRQNVNLGADYRVNQMLACTVGYTWQGTDRTNNQGTTSSHSPQVGLRLAPTNWLSLSANYAYTARLGGNFLTAENEGEAGTPLTFKSYAGSLTRNNFNLIAEVTPVNSVTTSLNFSIYKDNFSDSIFGIQSDQGWSVGADVSWKPHDRVALSLGYDRQQLKTNTVASNGFLGEPARVTGDEGPALTTSDSYNTFVARADLKLIPNKLTLTSRASYSFANSNFNNNIMTNLKEYYGDIRTFLTYQFNEHWACRAGYIFEAFGMPSAYQTLYLKGVSAAGASGVINGQQYNTLDGFFTNATAHIVQGFVQYKF